MKLGDKANFELKSNKRSKNENLKYAQNCKIENVAGLVLLSLYIDINGKCTISATSPARTGLSQIQHLIRKIVQLTYDLRRYNLKHKLVSMDSRMISDK
jgi:hypothetical protein